MIKLIVITHPDNFKIWITDYSSHFTLPNIKDTYLLSIYPYQKTKIGIDGLKVAE